MSTPFVAEVRMFGFNFAPVGWAACDGQILPISQNTALFSLLGTTYGGDGRSTFALPNLQGAFALGAGQGPGLRNRELGVPGGVPTVVLTANTMPPHSHTLNATASPTTRVPTSAALASTATGAPAYRIPGATTAMAANSLTGAGESQPHDNGQPSLVVMFCIAMQGIFPPRS